MILCIWFLNAILHRHSSSYYKSLLSTSISIITRMFIGLRHYWLRRFRSRIIQINPIYVILKSRHRPFE